MRCQVRNHSLLWRSAILVMMSDLPTLTWLPSTTLDMKLSISCRVAWDGYVGEGYRSVHILILILGVQPNLRKSSVNANHSRNGTSTLEAPSLETSTILARKHWKLSWVATNWHLRMLKHLFKRWNLRTRACSLQVTFDLSVVFFAACCHQHMDWLWLTCRILVSWLLLIQTNPFAVSGQCPWIWKTGWSCGFQIEAQFGRPGSVFGSKQTVEFAF